MLDNNKDNLKIYAGSLVGAVKVLQWFIEHENEQNEGSTKASLEDVIRLTAKIRGLI